MTEPPIRHQAAEAGADAVSRGDWIEVGWSDRHVPSTVDQALTGTADGGAEGNATRPFRQLVRVDGAEVGVSGVVLVLSDKTTVPGGEGRRVSLVTTIEPDDRSLLAAVCS